MKFCLLALIIIISGLNAYAQFGVDSRANALPYIHFDSKHPILPPYVLPGGEGIVLSPNTAIYPATKKVVEATWYAHEDDYKSCSFSGFVNSKIMSPNLRFGVNNAIACKQKLPDENGSTTFSTKTKGRDTMSKGFATSAADTPYAWCNIDQDYVLAVTNDGSIITTNAVDIKSKKNSAGNIDRAEIVKMKGLSLIDPRTGIRKVLREDLIKDGSGRDPQILVNNDATKIFILTRMASRDKDEASFIDVASGKKTILPWKLDLKAAQVGKEFLLATLEENMAIKTNLAVIYRIADGSKIFEHTSEDSVVQDFYLAENDDLYFHDSKTGEVAVLNWTDNNMKLSRHLTLKHEGMRSTQLRYSFCVLNDYIALVPSRAPSLVLKEKGYELEWGATRQYVYPVFFDLKSGNPVAIVHPFVTMAPTADQVKARLAETCKDMKRLMPWQEGSLICRKKSASSGANMILTGVDCDRSAYQLTSLDGSWISHEYNLYNYELCGGPGTFTICTKCKGVPQAVIAETVADDKWEQVNFNIYVRDLDKTKTQYREFRCDLCKGSGYLKK
jgi:hypothetical protein